jgi:hypothetical protein
MWQSSIKLLMYSTRCGSRGDLCGVAVRGVPHEWRGFLGPAGDLCDTAQGIDSASKQSGIRRSEGLKSNWNNKLVQQQSATWHKIVEAAKTVIATNLSSIGGEQSH